MGARRQPFLFGAWQARFLESVGVAIGDWWQNVSRQRQKEAEVHAWEVLMRGLDMMNRVAKRWRPRDSSYWMYLPTSALPVPLQAVGP
jgi:hypothetical protein